MAEEEDTDSSQKSEETINEEVHALSQSLYPLESTKQEKCIIRKKSKNFQFSIWCSALQGQGRIFAAGK